MKTKAILSISFLGLFGAFLGQSAVTLSQLGQSIDNSAVYSELQKEKSQAEIMKTQLMTQYAQLQALSNVNESELLAQGFVSIAQPLVLSAPATALASNLPEKGKLE